MKNKKLCLPSGGNLAKCWLWHALNSLEIWIQFITKNWRVWLRAVYCMTVPAVSKEEIGLHVTAAEDIVQRAYSVTSLCSSLWILEGWGFITLSSPEGDGQLWCAPRELHWALLGNVLFWRIWEQNKKASFFPGKKQRAEKMVGCGNVYERWPLSATFTSWLMLGIGVTQTEQAVWHSTLLTLTTAGLPFACCDQFLISEFRQITPFEKYAMRS